jgi:hypothetical protein
MVDMLGSGHISRPRIYNKNESPKVCNVLVSPTQL